MSKILLTTGRFLKEKPYFKYLTTICPPLELLPISTFLSRSNLENQILDTTFLTKEEFFHTLKSQKPHFIVYYVTVETEEFLLECLEKKKDFPYKIDFLICGKNIEHKSKFYLEKGADTVIYDTIEEPLTDLIHSLSLPMNPFIGHINGIAYKNGLDEITKTEPWKKELQAKHFTELLVDNFNFHPYLQHQKTCNLTPHLFFSVSYENDTISETCFLNTYEKLKQEYSFDYIEFTANQDNHITHWLGLCEQELPPFEIDFSSSKTILNNLAFPTAQQIWLQYPNVSQHEKLGWIIPNTLKNQQLEKLQNVSLTNFRFEFTKETKRDDLLIEIVLLIQEIQLLPKSWLNLKKWKLNRKLTNLLEKI